MPIAAAAVGDAAPDFTLTDLDGKTHKLSDYRGRVVVLEWFSPACPFCVYAYSDGPLAEQPERLMKEGVVWLSVNSQNPNHPGAKLEKNKSFVEKHGLEAPLLFDPTGAVGRSYGAKTTPHCFVIDAKGVLVYAGGLDNAPNGKVEGDAEPINYVDAAIADLKAGRPVATKSTRAYG
jgi:peroxiredoxin